MKDAYRRVPYNIQESQDGMKENYASNTSAYSKIRQKMSIPSEQSYPTAKFISSSDQPSDSVEHDKTYLLHKHNMEEDKINLSHRLNSVIAELEKATAEKQEIEIKLEFSVQKVIELENELEESKAARENRDNDLNDEIRYERQLNNKLQCDIKKSENQRDMLKERLKEQERFSKQLNSDTNRVSNEFHNKSKELKLLEEEYVQSKGKLSNLQRELQSLRNYEKFSKEETARLEEEIERLTIEKKKLISLSKLKKQPDSRFKTLSSKLMLLKILQVSYKPVKEAFEVMRQNRFESKSREKAVKRMDAFVNKLEHSRVQKSLKTWYLTVFDFIETDKSIMELADSKYSLKEKSKYFFLWRTVYFSQMNKKNNKQE